VVRAMMDGHRPAVWLSDRYMFGSGTFLGSGALGD
jgi:hypothetical protein